MANNNIVPTVIVRQLLDEHNFYDWSVQVRTYLLAQDLWDVVEAPIPSEAETEAGKAWCKRNAAALHAIHISCSSDAFNVIRKICWAKEAWDTLAIKFSDSSSPAKEGQQDQNVSENAVNDEYSPEYMCFFNDVGEGNWEAVEQFLTLHQEAVRVKSPSYGRTALHVAVTFGHLHIVEELVKLMTAEELEIEDCDGFTAFLIAVDKGNISMVKCMLEKNANLLRIPTKKDPLPVLSAILSGRKEMVRYLYSLTVQQQVLLENNGSPGVSLLISCIYSSIF
ncbi:hypothetical protein UlMin_024979, partial [Ulmus minor]